MSDQVCFDLLLERVFTLLQRCANFSKDNPFQNLIEIVNSELSRAKNIDNAFVFYEGVA